MLVETSRRRLMFAAAGSITHLVPSAAQCTLEGTLVPNPAHDIGFADDAAAYQCWPEGLPDSPEWRAWQVLQSELNGQPVSSSNLRLQAPVFNVEVQCNAAHRIQRYWRSRKSRSAERLDAEQGASEKCLPASLQLSGTITSSVL